MPSVLPSSSSVVPSSASQRNSNDSKEIELKEVKVHFDSRVLYDADTTQTAVPASRAANAIYDENIHVRAQLPTKNQCLSVLGTFAALGAIGYVGYLQFASAQEDNGIKDHCVAISHITNSSNTAVLCYQNQENFIVDKCIEKLELTSWAIAMAVMTATIPVFSYLTTTVIGQYLNVQRRDWRLNLSLNCFALPTLNCIMQAINAFTLGELAIRHQNNECIAFCQENYSAKNCAVDRTYTCTPLCQLSEPFDFRWMAVIAQVTISGIFGCAKSRALRS